MLAYAHVLGILLKSGWSVALADMVLREVTHNEKPTSVRIRDSSIPVLETSIFLRTTRSPAPASCYPATGARYLLLFTEQQG